MEMILTGLRYCGDTENLTPAIIIDGVIYFYDFNYNKMFAKKEFNSFFEVFCFVKREYAMLWWHKNMDIAHKWAMGESKDASPKFDKEFLKAIPSEIVEDLTKRIKK